MLSSTARRFARTPARTDPAEDVAFSRSRWPHAAALAFPPHRAPEFRADAPIPFPRTVQITWHDEKKATAVHGWLVLDKPISMTSTQAVGEVTRRSTHKRPGMPALSIRWRPAFCRSRWAKRRRPCLAVDGEKAYRFTVRWGAETETDDTEGARDRHQRETSRAVPTSKRCCRDFHGEIMQAPPALSPRSRSTANAPTISLAPAKPSCLSPVPCQSTISTLVAMPDDATSVFEAGCGRAPTCAPSPATWAAAWVATATSSRSAAPRSGLSIKPAP